MEQGNILNLMVSHHALLDALSGLFRDEVRDNSPTVEKSLTELSWELKKHFFTEENAIFDFIPLKNIDIWKTMNTLKDEHLAMMDSLKDFAEKLPDISEADLDAFYELLSEHREVEEHELYPRIDKDLSAEHKHQIIVRINEIPITK